MKPNIAGRDQTGLDNEQNDPGGKDSAMEMDQQAGQMGEDCASQEITGSEAHEDNCQHDDRHRGEEDVVSTFGSKEPWPGRGLNVCLHAQQYIFHFCDPYETCLDFINAACSMCFRACRARRSLSAFRNLSRHGTHKAMARRVPIVITRAKIFSDMQVSCAAIAF
jgi:hypothetical protein